MGAVGGDRDRAIESPAEDARPAQRVRRGRRPGTTRCHSNPQNSTHEDPADNTPAPVTPHDAPPRHPAPQPGGKPHPTLAPAEMAGLGNRTTSGKTKIKSPPGLQLKSALP